MKENIQDKGMKISVIISVYNHFEWLRLILDAMRQQTYQNFEVIIADDGSSEENVEKIKKYISRYPEIKILHYWHEDEGWRKNKALNGAVRLSKGDYLVFIDGDCIPHPEFVADHARLARKGFVMGGRRVETGKALSDMIESWEKLPKDYFTKARVRILKSVFKESMGKTLSQLRRTWRFPFVAGKPLGVKSQGILGANFGIFRSDFEKVNGFDERYVDPGTGEDCDLDVRLENAGVYHLKASHYALMLHRHHDRLDWSSENNSRLFAEARTKKITKVANGVMPL